MQQSGKLDYEKKKQGRRNKLDYEKVYGAKKKSIKTD